MKLSVQDFKGATSGFLTLLCLIFLVNLIANAFLDSGLKSISVEPWFATKVSVLLSLLYSIMLYALVLSVLYLLFSYAVRGVVTFARSKRKP